MRFLLSLVFLGLLPVQSFAIGVKVEVGGRQTSCERRLVAVADGDTNAAEPLKWRLDRQTITIETQLNSVQIQGGGILGGVFNKTILKKARESFESQFPGGIVRTTITGTPGVDQNPGHYVVNLENTDHGPLLSVALEYTASAFTSEVVAPVAQKLGTVPQLKTTPVIRSAQVPVRFEIGSWEEFIKGEEVRFTVIDDQDVFGRITNTEWSEHILGVLTEILHHKISQHIRVSRRGDVRMNWRKVADAVFEGNRNGLRQVGPVYSLDMSVSY